MELDITPLVRHDAFSPWDMSNSVANLGDNVGRLTWGNSVACAKEIALLDADEKKEAFRDFVKSSGGWTREEIDAWDDTELNALFNQWVAGDVQEAFGYDADVDEWDWEQYEQDAQDGRVSSNIFKGTDGKIYFYIGV